MRRTCAAYLTNKITRVFMTDANDITPEPQGELTLQIIAMPSHTNKDGDIYGGWLVSQMDLAGAQRASHIANGRVATVAIDNMAFVKPVPLGATVYCYAGLLEVGRSSIQIRVEAWINSQAAKAKVTDAIFTFVAIDEQGHTRPVSR